MKCVNCGKELAEGNLFCDGCGTKVEAAPVEAPVETPVEPVAPTQPNPPVQPYYGYQPMPPKGNGGLKVLIAIMAVIILAGIGFGVWYFALRGDDNGSGNNNTSGNSNTNTNVNNVVNTNTNNAINHNTNNTVNPNPPIGGDRLVCTSTTTEDGATIIQTITATFSGGTLSNLKAEMKFEDDETASMYYSIISMYDEMASDPSEKLNVTLSGNVITINNYENMTNIMGEEEAEISYDDLMSMTKEEFAEEMSASGVTCR